MNKTIAILPARGGSKRLPKKNIKLLGDIPLVAHSILYAKKHSFIKDVYVSTDDDEIKKIALEYGAKVIDRPKEISGDNEPTVSALKHVLETISVEIENVVLLQVTNPLRQADLLQNAYQVFKDNNCESLFTVSQDYHKLGKIKNNKFEPFNYKFGQRSQDLDPLFYENGLLYITKANLILEDIIISKNAFPFQINHIFATVDIDTKEDFEYAEYLYSKYIKM
ncbi:acylneuraminate cytidylyltransferase family protein [Flavobacterium sediminilitoris]|uniref:Acylneuraminate cytidylyltransferase family protein n=1 Tax=Flavobacterium sediminilitoris TaxID=2024526 RepID=A0ABY4HMW1_9FLAO|nr:MULTISPECIES: acylneuraminate cytidylyltransferase family protein [Flavobacterium]UOX34023.1 acylneuraminate cytidylyltransferase family protein [Flavobacterium sediminilitoris]